MPPNHIKLISPIYRFTLNMAERLSQLIKNPYRRILLLFFFSISHSQTAFADCTPSTVSLTLPNLTMNINNAALNGPIGGELVSSELGIFTCTMWSNSTFPSQVVSRRVDYQNNGTSTGITINGRNIYKTNITGIGFAIAFEPTNFCSNTIRWAPSACSMLPSASTLYAKIHLQLYKIGPITNISNITLTNGSFRMIESYQDNSATYFYSYTRSNSFNLAIYTCSMTSASTTSVKLPNVYGNNFFANGISAGSTPFSITVNCPNPTNLNITFTDNNNIGQTGNYLTPLASSTAKGLGVQLQYNGNIISFGPDSSDPGTTNQIVLNSNFTGTQTFPFTAAYVRTGTVTPGTLSARATFTLSYQ